MTFGNGIRKLRQARVGGIHDLAALARIPCRTLSLIEADGHFPRLSELERLLAALDVRLRDVYLAGSTSSDDAVVPGN